jgi:hypothetical protein
MIASHDVNVNAHRIRFSFGLQAAWLSSIVAYAVVRPTVTSVQNLGTLANEDATVSFQA